MSGMSGGHQKMASNLLRTGRFVTVPQRATRPLSYCRSSHDWTVSRDPPIFLTETAGLAPRRRQQQLSSSAAARATPPPSFLLGRPRHYSALRSSRDGTSAEDNNQDNRTEREVKSVPSSSSSSSSTSSSPLPTPPFRPGQRIQVEVISFGPMGASVDIVADTHDPEGVIADDIPPLGRGLILQKEIAYFRQGRDNVVRTCLYMCSCDVSRVVVGVMSPSQTLETVR